MRGRNVMYTLDSRVLALAFLGAGCGSGSSEEDNSDAGLSKDIYVTDRDTGMPTPTGPIGPTDASSSIGSDANSRMDSGNVPDANNNMDANSRMPDASNGVPDANNIPDAHNVPDGGTVVTNTPPTLDPAVPNMYEIPIGTPLIFKPKGEDPDVGDSLEYRADIINMSGDIVYSTHWNNSREVPIMLSGMAPQDLILALYVKDMAGNETQRDVPVKAVNIPTGEGPKPIARGCRYNQRDEFGRCVVPIRSGELFCEDYGLNGTGSYHPEQSKSITSFVVYPRKDGPLSFGGVDSRVCFRRSPTMPVDLEGELIVEDEGGLGHEGRESVIFRYSVE
ncbi:MAG TPA: hypothetical protein VJG30_04545 [Candidatus Nanoarchaeia archaeon]|nr:hypothetical protein [Candidatus Nanoarchaeia archaeon]